MTSQPPSPRRPTDLSPAEAEVAGWFEGAGRGGAPSGAGLLLCARPRADVRPRSGPAWRPFAAAAALLFVLVAPAEVSVPAGSAGDPLFASSSMTVIDDPSVPALHALDTFEQLAWVGHASAGNVR